jgi:hypothetical protein
MRTLSPLIFALACASEPPKPPAPAPTPTPPAEVVEEEAPAAAVDRPPRIANINIEPKHPTIKDTLKVTVTADDPDGDKVDVDYLWMKGEQKLLTDTTEKLSMGEFKKGDLISVKITASANEQIVEKQSDPITVANSAPVFTLDPRQAKSLDGLKVTAEDPDGDALTFKLEGAPAGMTIDATTGTLRYVGSEDEPGGDYKVTVLADDGDGGFAKWQAGLTVTPGSKAAKAAKEAKAAEAAKKAPGR